MPTCPDYCRKSNPSERFCCHYRDGPACVQLCKVKGKEAEGISGAERLLTDVTRDSNDGQKPSKENER
ncbi:hypothetical protein NDU88_002448 [Pleurodeles waltl]|uniref:HIT-type domain-containing protein n=1 Tax=Pleurodeles waltl TaxID=8319 RepID=A0AAV7UVM7_PLEWA|nr:hypothetical protein NDU88_002448 [Pleurodeles waltl]